VGKGRLRVGWALRSAAGWRRGAIVVVTGVRRPRGSGGRGRAGGVVPRWWKAARAAGLSRRPDAGVAAVSPRAR